MENILYARYVKFLEKKKDSKDLVISNLAHELCACSDDEKTLRQKYISIFSNFKTTDPEIMEIIYIVEKILLHINK